MVRAAVEVGLETTLFERDEVLRLLEHLSARQREAIVLRYILDLTQEQVAEQMDLAPGTVAAKSHTACRVNPSDCWVTPS